MSYDLSIVIPWKTPELTPGSAGKAAQQWRITNFNWIKARYEGHFPEAQLVIADAGGAFNRSRYINHGVQKATRDYVLIADADTIPYADPILKGLDYLDHDRGPGWVIPYGDAGYYNSDRESAERILKRSPMDHITPDQITWEHRLLSWSGQVLIPRNLFLSVGGFDERFEGWGYEDNAFVDKCDTLIGDHWRVQDGWTIHIWHPAPEHTTWQQPNIDANRQLREKYGAAKGDRAAMRRLAKGGQ